MILRQSAPVKLNLGLHVLRRREDGYHDLETVFLRIPWADEVSIRPAERLTMSCSDPTLPTDERNLCVRAARALAEFTGRAGGAEIHLDKHVPYGAGLGGGSSDAAAVLKLLSELWRAEIGYEPLRIIAAGLGSDVPFFLGPSAAYGTGRGEVLSPLIDPDTGEVYRLPFSLVVVVPPVEISTALAYRLVRPSDNDRPDLPTVVLSNDLERWRAELVNDFEAPVFDAFPAVRSAKELLLDAGADYASLSGSGAAVFGVFEDATRATAAAEAARMSGLRVWQGSIPGE